MTINPANERLKHRYFSYLRETKSLGEQAIDQVAKALDRFEAHHRRRNLGDYRTEHAISFKKALSVANGARSGTRLSKATVTSTLHALRGFFLWLAEQKGFRHRIQRTDADYFKPLRSDEAIARAARPTIGPSVDQVRAMLSAMPDASQVNRRDRALVALIMLTGARDNAAASVRLKHLDLADRQLFQDAREMRTKNRKTFSTWFFPVGEDFVAILASWKAELQALGFGPDSPLFPKTALSFGPNGETLEPGLGRECWANADPIRKLFKSACAAAGTPYFNPHSLRNTLAQVGASLCQTPEAYKAWSQNLGHEDVLVTLTSYGTVPSFRQRDLILGMNGSAST